jgi:hypothetical protein
MPEHSRKQLVFDIPGVYRIRVGGGLSESWSDSLAGMTIATSMVDDEQYVTTLTGLLRDQAALAGVLNTIRELGLPLLSVERLENEPGGEHP